MFGSDQPFVAMSLDESDTESPELVYFSDLPLQKGASWVHALSLGTFEHPLHGTVTITPERVQRLADGVNNRVRGQDLDVDYDHKARTGEAAGWVRKAEARPDGLWLFVEWTKEALGKIKSRAYRYFSSEFVEKWKDPKSGTVHKDVLFG